MSKSIPLRPVAHENIKPLLKLIVYGAPGVGKTTLAATAAEHKELRNVLFLSIEGGMLSVPASPYIIKEEIRNGGDYSAFEHIESYFWALAQRDYSTYPWMKDIRTVVIDSGSELLTLALESIAAQDLARGGSKRKSIDETWISDYGDATKALKRLYRYFRDLPYNFVLTALSKNIYPKGTDNSNLEPIAVTPNFTEKLGESVMGYMDHVWYMFRDEAGVPAILTREYKSYRGKTRGKFFNPALGLNVSNPNLAEIYEILIKSEGAHYE